MPNKPKNTTEVSFATVNEWRSHFFNNAVINILEPHNGDSAEASDLSEMLWERIRSQPVRAGAPHSKKAGAKKSLRA